MNAELIFKHTQGLDFSATPNDPSYHWYWEGPDISRKGGSLLNKHPRELYILYENGIHRSVFLETKRFKIVHNVKKFFILKGK